jgi:hypothetical protein
MPPSKKKITKKLTEILAVIDEEDKLLGYFKDINAVERFFEKEAIDQATILTVVKVENAEYPPEPTLEFFARELSEVIKGE